MIARVGPDFGRSETPAEKCRHIDLGVISIEVTTETMRQSLALVGRGGACAHKPSSSHHHAPFPAEPQELTLPRPWKAWGATRCPLSINENLH